MELVENICKKNQEIIQQIYEKIYKQFNAGVIDVFLCGGTDKNSIRNTLRRYLLENKGIRVLYPEDLFLELLNTNKEYNLLELENFLAENCDIICIICESPGSLVELGAFVNNKNLSEKVVALIEKNKAKKQSFIMLGPIKSLKKMGKHHYSAYEKNNVGELAKKLKNIFKNNKEEQNNNCNKTEINTIIGLYYFIQILLYFFTSIKQIQVFKLLRKKGYNDKISAIIAGLCTYDGYLPQGGITSPIISNLICNSLDKRLVGLCSKRDINYSRYADDMTFSSNEKSALKKIIPIITDIIKQEGFTINEEKTRFSCPGSRKVITGVNINSNELKAKKELKRKVRAMIHKSIIQQDYKQNNKIQGLVAYINSIEQGYKEKICNYIESFEEKLMFEPNSKEIFEQYNKNKIIKNSKDLKNSFD